MLLFVVCCLLLPACRQAVTARKEELARLTSPFPPRTEAALRGVREAAASLRVARRTGNGRTGVVAASHDGGTGDGRGGQDFRVSLESLDGCTCRAGAIHGMPCTHQFALAAELPDFDALSLVHPALTTDALRATYAATGRWRWCPPHSCPSRRDACPPTAVRQQHDPASGSAMPTAAAMATAPAARPLVPVTVPNPGSQAQARPAAGRERLRRCLHRTGYRGLVVLPRSLWRGSSGGSRSSSCAPCAACQDTRSEHAAGSRPSRWPQPPPPLLPPPPRSQRLRVRAWQQGVCHQAAVRS